MKDSSPGLCVHYLRTSLLPPPTSEVHTKC